jgi:hypothetical protein
MTKKIRYVYPFYDHEAYRSSERDFEKDINSFDYIIEEEKRKLQNIKPDEYPVVNALSEQTGYLLHKIPNNIFDILKNTIKKNKDIKTKDFSQNTVGHIDGTYELEPTEELKNYLYELSQIYVNVFPKYRLSLTDLIHDYRYEALDRIIKLDVGSFWVNFQKKYEFNPIHNHAGVFSFVIWIKVPYTMENELLHSPCKRNDNKNNAGCFGFVYPNYSRFGVETRIIRVDRNYEGVICFFPSELNHFVYPFYTDDGYRISVAGNLVLVK